LRNKEGLRDSSQYAAGGCEVAGPDSQGFLGASGCTFLVDPLVVENGDALVIIRGWQLDTVHAKLFLNSSINEILLLE
jgi:hypothetical protein